MPNNKSVELSLDEKITNNIKFEIEHSGKTKAEIARAVGIKQSSVSQYLSGRAQPTLANLSKLCSFIGCSADDILEVKKG